MNNQTGFTLIELLIAIGSIVTLLFIVIAAIIAIIYYSTK